VVELAYTCGLSPHARKGLRVQLSPLPPIKKGIKNENKNQL